MKIETKFTGALRRNAPALAVCGIAAVAVLLPEIALAGSAQGLPWEGGLTKLKDSLTGPVAMVVSLLALVGCFIGLAFGGEMNDFLRKAIMVVMAISGVVGASSIMSVVFNASGAVVAMGGLVGLA